MQRTLPYGRLVGHEEFRNNFQSLVAAGFSLEFHFDLILYFLVLLRSLSPVRRTPLRPLPFTLPVYAMEGKALTINGELEYQACDKTMCYVPTSVPVRWQFEVFPLDRVRAPLDIRHK